MPKKRKPKWGYRTELSPKPFKFNKGQLTEIKNAVCAAGKIPTDSFKEFIALAEDELEGYNAYRVVEDGQPKIAEVRAALDELRHFTVEFVERLDVLDPRTRELWAPYLEILFDNISSISRSPRFYLDNNFRDNVDVLRRFLRNVEDSFCPAQEVVKTAPTARGGAPRKQARLNFIRALAAHYQKHLGLQPYATNQGTFEQVVLVCLNAAGDPIKNVHEKVCEALIKK